MMNSATQVGVPGHTVVTFLMLFIILTFLAGAVFCIRLVCCSVVCFHWRWISIPPSPILFHLLSEKKKLAKLP